MKQRHPHNIQTRLSPEHMAFVLSLADKPADGIRRALDIARQAIDASKTDQPARQLAYYLARASELAAQVAAAEAQCHPAPPTMAGSTAAPGQPIPASVDSPAPLYKEGTAPGQPAPPAQAPAGDGFEGWD